MGKNAPKKNLVEIGSPVFANSFKTHMMEGNDKGSRHSGLHAANELIRDNSNYTMDVIERDCRNRESYTADVRLQGNDNSKRSTFFPNDMNYDAVKAKVIEAWRDSRTYTRDDTIYKDLAAKYGLSWVGMAQIGTQKIWIGSTKSGAQGQGLETAFPAVNNKFLKGGG